MKEEKKRGRPQKTEEEKRVQVHISMRPQDLEKIDESAQGEGMTRSEFIRHVLHCFLRDAK